MSTDFTPVYEQARRWANKTDSGRIEAETVALRFASWLCGYYADDIAGDRTPDYEVCWAKLHKLHSDLATITTFGPAYKHAHDWGRLYAIGHVNDETAERFAAWFCGFYAEDIVNDDLGVTYPTAWERFVECFSDVAEQWGC
jgi:hypothetical protein